ncbi:PHD finger protein ALFIN-LIKE 3-like [Malania oleifera]|uniref:PHD finger protein ALFIN-LIKE 3-like n=1 Tax=Malania oleifera TaxID=397392 RepID=UPI0025ADE2B3|nr:PHD finger protein ALFIN-LIKE 3-like [Malania oleifera]
MEMASSSRTVEEIFKDYNSRRASLVRALTYYVNGCYGLYDPDKENLCLYIQPNETWEVTLLTEEVPLLEPALGINDGQVKGNSRLVDESYEEDEDEHSETFCGSCSGNYNANEFWIGCKICEK